MAFDGVWGGCRLCSFASNWLGDLGFVGQGAKAQALVLHPKSLNPS